MTDAQHTPGPWGLDEVPIETGESAGWYCVTNENFDADVAIAVTKADAILIRAAPDLLAALHEVLSLCDRDSDIGRVVIAAIAETKGN